MCVNFIHKWRELQFRVHSINNVKQKPHKIVNDDHLIRYQIFNALTISNSKNRFSLINNERHFSTLYMLYLNKM